MRKIWISLMLALFLFAAPEAHAALEATIKDGKLIIVETIVVKTVPDVPEGLSADDAYMLVMGRLPEVLVSGQSVKRDYVVRFVSIRQTIETLKKAVAYRDNKWIVEKAPSEIKESDTFLSWMFIYVPGLLIGMLSFRNVLSESGMGGLAISYLLIFWGGAITNSDIGSYFVMLACALGAIGGSVSNEHSKGLGAILGGLAGLLIAICTSELGKTHNQEGLLLYSVSMIAIGGVSFLANFGARAMKGKVQAVLAAKRA